MRSSRSTAKFSAGSPNEIPVLGDGAGDPRASLEEYGGDPGVRDQGLLESAVANRARFGGKDLYPGIAEKAAALAFSLVMNHPFFDGNKRTGYGAM